MAAALSWREGVRELRRLLVMEGGDPDDIHDVDLAWRAFRAFLAVALDDLFDRWEGDVEADTLVIEFPVTDWSDDRPGLLIARRFAIPAVEWRDGVPGEPSANNDDLAFADTVQIQMELRFPHGTTADADGFWTAQRSGEFDEADLEEAGELVTGLRLGRPTSTTVELMNCNYSCHALATDSRTQLSVRRTDPPTLYRQANRVVSILAALTLLIAGCGLAVSVSGSLVERKRPFTLLRLSGSSTGTLHRVVLLEALLPLTGAAILAAAIGLGLAYPIARTLAPTRHALALPGSDYLVILGVGMAAAVMAIAACLPILSRITHPNTARFE